jgi:hypothetical protein
MTINPDVTSAAWTAYAVSGTDPASNPPSVTLSSKRPEIPEWGHSSGVLMTTDPLPVTSLDGITIDLLLDLNAGTGDSHHTRVDLFFAPADDLPQQNPYGLPAYDMYSRPSWSETAASFHMEYAICNGSGPIADLRTSALTPFQITLSEQAEGLHVTVTKSGIVLDDRVIAGPVRPWRRPVASSPSYPGQLRLAWPDEIYPGSPEGYYAMDFAAPMGPTWPWVGPILDVVTTYPYPENTPIKFGISADQTVYPADPEPSAYVKVANIALAFPVTATVPDAPTMLSYWPHDEAVELFWTAPASDGGSAITDYLVEYHAVGSGTWLTASHGGPSTATTQLVTGLADRTFYTFRVSAINAIGTGPGVEGSGIVPQPSITDLWDVAITGTANRDVLRYNGSTARWENAASPVIVVLTQTEYDALGTPDASTLYVIKG